MANCWHPTGATGFVGSHVAERLLGAGFRVRLLVRNPRRLKWVQPEQFELLIGDITKSESCRQRLNQLTL